MIYALIIFAVTTTGENFTTVSPHPTLDTCKTAGKAWATEVRSILQSTDAQAVWYCVKAEAAGAL